MHALYEELVVKWGWFSPSDAEGLLSMSVADREEVIDAILRAEYGNPHAAENATRRRVGALVDDWLFDPSGRGASSGLP